MTPILTRAMLTNALDALRIEQDGTVASVTITPTAILIVHANTEAGNAWSEIRHLTPAGESQS